MKRYTLVLDTYAHNEGFNGYYKRDGFASKKEAYTALHDMIAKQEVTMLYSGNAPKKIYCAFLFEGKKPIKRTDNGFTWYNHEHPMDRYPMDTMIKI